MSRPTSVTICGQPFAVDWEDAPGKRLHEDSEDYWSLGTTVVTEQRLVIRTTAAAEQLHDTVLHEILHAVVKMTAHRDDFAGKARGEEAVVYAVATALLAVLRGNPELVAWLTEDLA